MQPIATTPRAQPASATAVRLREVRVEVPGAARPLLRGLDWTVRRGERWAVIGANGAGKTTLLRLLTGALTPSAGEISILDGTPGRGGLRDPRLRTGLLEGRPSRLAAQLTAVEVVTLLSTGPAAMIGATASDEQTVQARELLELFGCDGFADRPYNRCSQGERQRIQLARVLMRRPELLLLDEPITGLDLPGRERLLRSLTRLADRQPEQVAITVTHHLEELPASTTHALLLREGTPLAAGPIAETITSQSISRCLGIGIEVARAGGRWTARAVDAG